MHFIVFIETQEIQSDYNHPLSMFRTLLILTIELLFNKASWISKDSVLHESPETGKHTLSGYLVLRLADPLKSLLIHSYSTYSEDELEL